MSKPGAKSACCCLQSCTHSRLISVASSVLMCHVAADWLITRHRASLTALCACLEALPLLVHGGLELPQNLYNVEDHSKSADRYSYSALSGLVCAAQMRTALALHEVGDSSPYKADAFHYFWPSAVSRYREAVNLNAALCMLHYACCILHTISASGLLNV